MKMYTIEVDEEVYRFLEKNALPFVDKTPGSVVRRLLLGEKIDKVKDEQLNTKLPNFPQGIRDGLRQILEVIYLVKHGDVRIEAVKKVAAAHGVKIPTIADKYIRGLGLKSGTVEFDILLQEPSLNKIKDILLNNYSLHRDIIIDFFDKLSQAN